MKPFYSIIIPTLNEELFLPKILSDLKNQKEKNFEVIIVDGSSTDSTHKVATAYRTHLPIKFLKANKRNVSHQRNIGAKKANGEYFIFVDADARINPMFIKQLSKELSKNKSLIILPALYPLGGNQSDRVLFKVANFFFENSLNLSKPIPSGSLMIFQRHLFNHIGGYRETRQQDKKVLYPEDWDIILRASNSGVKAKFMRNLKVRFSLRRFKGDKFNVVKNYIEAAIQWTTKGKLKKNIAYQMGGHLYVSDKTKESSLKEIEKLLKEAKGADSHTV